MTSMYIPPIKFDKVVKIHDEHTIKIDSSKEIDETIYRFIIYIDENLKQP